MTARKVLKFPILGKQVTMSPMVYENLPQKQRWFMKYLDGKLSTKLKFEVSQLLYVYCAPLLSVRFDTNVSKQKTLLLRAYGSLSALQLIGHTLTLHHIAIYNAISIDQATSMDGSTNNPSHFNASRTFSANYKTPTKTTTTPALREPSPIPLTARKTSTKDRKNFDP